MKAFRGDVGGGLPSTPAPSGFEKGTGWSAMRTPESVHSRGATPLFHSMARSVRSTSTMGSIGYVDMRVRALKMGSKRRIFERLIANAKCRLFE